MADQQAKRDENSIFTLLAVTDDANQETRPVEVDSNGRVKVSAVISSALDDLSDVDAASPNDGDVLTYNNGTGNWEASASAAGATLTAETPTGTVNGSNTSFTVNNEPLFVIIDGMFRVSGQGYSYAGGTITVDAEIPPVNFIRSFYNA